MNRKTLNVTVGIKGETIALYTLEKFLCSCLPCDLLLQNLQNKFILAVTCTFIFNPPSYATVKVTDQIIYHNQRRSGSSTDLISI